MIRFLVGYSILLGTAQVLMHPGRRWDYGTDERIPGTDLPHRAGTTMEQAIVERDKKRDSYG